MHSPATSRIRVLCGRRRCHRLLTIAEVDGGDVSYRIPERPSAATVRLHDVPPSFRLAGSMTDVTAAFTALRRWDGTPDHRTVVFPAHYSCRATPEVRQDRLDELVCAAVAAGKTSVTV
jgi:hypothetical protein